MKRILAFILAAALIGCLALPVSASETEKEVVTIAGLGLTLPPEGYVYKKSDQSMTISLNKAGDAGVTFVITDMSQYPKSMQKVMPDTQQEVVLKSVKTDSSVKTESKEYTILGASVFFEEFTLDKKTFWSVGTFSDGKYAYTITCTCQTDDNKSMDAYHDFLANIVSASEVATSEPVEASEPSSASLTDSEKWAGVQDYIVNKLKCEYCDISEKDGVTLISVAFDNFEDVVLLVKNYNMAKAKDTWSSINDVSISLYNKIVNILPSFDLDNAVIQLNIVNENNHEEIFTCIFEGNIIYDIIGTPDKTPDVNTEKDSGEVTIGMKNALKSANQYLAYSAFSRSGLIKQLEYEKYTHDEAVYAVDHCGADWNEQAAKSAKQYLDYASFSRSGLIDQLEYEGFTHSQAVYGAQKNGY